VARRLAACIDDPRARGRIRHGLAGMLRFRLLMIAAGCEDGNDADSLRPARRPTGDEARNPLRRLVAEIRSHGPRVEIPIRADTRCCAPEVLDFCRAARIDFLLGVATTTTLRQSYARVSTHARREVARLIHRGRHREAERKLSRMRTWLGRLVRDIARKTPAPRGPRARQGLRAARPGRAIPRSSRSARLLSMDSLPSSRWRTSASHLLSAFCSAFPRGGRHTGRTRHQRASRAARAGERPRLSRPAQGA